MKTRSLQSLARTFTTVAVVTLLAVKAAGQDSTTSSSAATTTPAAAQPAAASRVTPQLSYGVAEVVQLAHANVSEDVIVNYVQNSGNAYGLDANQILYLKQQGVSDRIVNTMLDQRSRLAAAQTATPQNSADAGNAQTATVVAPPTVTYAQPASASTVYIIPDTQTYNYYAYSYPYYYPYYYGYYGWPGVSFSFGYRGYYGGYPYHNWGGWHGGGGWHSSGGWHGGGGPHGGHR